MKMEKIIVMKTFFSDEENNYEADQNSNDEDDMEDNII